MQQISPLHDSDVNRSKRPSAIHHGIFVVPRFARTKFMTVEYPFSFFLIVLCTDAARNPSLSITYPKLNGGGEELDSCLSQGYQREVKRKQGFPRLELRPSIPFPRTIIVTLSAPPMDRYMYIFNVYVYVILYACVKVYVTCIC